MAAGALGGENDPVVIDCAAVMIVSGIRTVRSRSQELAVIVSESP
jgi:hypothetical protein